MSVEADLLTWIDSLIVETLAFSPGEGLPGGVRRAALAELCAKISPAAIDLEMTLVSELGQNLDDRH